MNNVINNLTARENLVVIFYDLTAAFNIVNHGLLLDRRASFD